jgi:hypothetical protein
MARRERDETDWDWLDAAERWPGWAQAIAAAAALAYLPLAVLLDWLAGRNHAVYAGRVYPGRARRPG